jgi:hypothetical protein
MPRARSLIGPLAVLAPLMAGCSGVLGGGPATTIAPHVVFLAPEGCGAAVAKVHRGGYALMATVEAGYTMAQGDVLEGPAREGESIFRRFPPAARNNEWSEGIETPIDVLATGLELRDARQRLDARCVVEAETLPRLPGT